MAPNDTPERADDERAENERPEGVRRKILSGMGLLSGLFLLNKPVSAYLGTDSDDGAASIEASTEETTTTTTTTEETTTTTTEPEMPVGGEFTFGSTSTRGPPHPLYADPEASKRVDMLYNGENLEEEINIIVQFFVEGELEERVDFLLKPGDIFEQSVTLDLPEPGRNEVELCVNDRCAEFPIIVLGEEGEDDEEDEDE